ncbi:MAG: alanine dehydrogenase, partial [Oscillospiraceae bacterium]|nr:alanine dehydrogenase [Oscillospiraceae bacterium]
MIFGVVKEITPHEHRVGLTPMGVKTLVERGHEVLVEKNAGIDSGFSDEQYNEVGGTLFDEWKDVYKKSEIVVKVTPPTVKEYKEMKSGQSICSFLHMATNKKLVDYFTENKITGIAYETITDEQGSLPVVLAMSEIAGRLSVHLGAELLLKRNGGNGVLLGGVPGVEPCHVLIIGGGVVGENAAQVAIGTGAMVTIIDINIDRLRELDKAFFPKLRTLSYSSETVAAQVKDCDLLISAVLVPGKRTPIVVTEKMVRTMKEGSVIIDISSDQGGSVETVAQHSPLEDVTYYIHGVTHCSITNIAGDVPRTSTLALTNATMPYLLEMADKGIISAIKTNRHLKEGVNTYAGHVTYRAVADSLDLPYKKLDKLL